MARNVLVVDDDEGYLLAVQRLLEDAGYGVRTARSADEARGQLAAQRPDLILLDVLMPAEDGFTFADTLSKAPDLADIPVVLVTAVADHPGQVMYALEQDKAITASDILPKAQVHERLLATVTAALGR